MNSDPPYVLGTLSPQEFLSTYWQKKPCLIRQALPDFKSPLNPEELAGLACEEEIESRLVLQNMNNSPWHVRQGPFQESDFQSLPETHWSLLVQDVDKVIPEVAALATRFNFIPSWRIDDIMISYAQEGGSVGPHLDSYDVFLLQGMGQRHWSINCNDYTEADFISDLDLRIIDNFQSEQEWLLEPGDVLYLPPGVAHEGTAITPGMTFSIGFQAPQQTELLQAYLDDCLSERVRDCRYTDRDLPLQENSGEITANSLDRIRALMLDCLSDKDELNDWFGKYITSLNRVDISEDENILSREAFIKRFKQARWLYRDTHYRSAFIRRSDVIRLYINGNEFVLPDNSLNLAKTITETVQLDYDDVKQHPEQEALLDWLHKFYLSGYYYLAE